MNSIPSLLSAGVIRRSPCALVVAVLASFMSVAAAQSMSIYERVRLDIGTTANAASPHSIGSNPIAIAWNGHQLYAAGINSSASSGTTAITQITNPNAVPGLSVVPSFGPSFGTLTTSANRGYSGLALTSGKLGASWDNGASSPSGIQGFDTSSNTFLWNLSASGGTAANVGSSRGMSGISVDPGYQGITSQGGGGFAWTTQGSGRRAENDPTTGIPTYVLSGNATPANPSSVGGMIASSTSTLWRDITFDPATGDLYSRNNNLVTMNVRTGANSLVTGINIVSGLTISNTSNSIGANIEFLSRIESQGSGSYEGNALIFNDRASNTSAQPWTSVIKITTTGSTTVAAIPTAWNMLYGASVNGSSLYDFGWDATTQTLAVMDYSNRTISIFDLDVTVQTVAGGTQTASLSGTTPLAKRGAGTLVTDQAGAIATNTVYVEEGTLQIGSGGTSGWIGSPVAVTVSSGANVVFDRSDDYGGSFANLIGGAGGVEVRGGALTVTAANSYTGGTLVSGGTLSVGAGGTTGSLAGTITTNGALVFNRSDATTFTDTIAGSGSLTKAGEGRLTLTRANTLTGPTTVLGGVLQLANGSALAASRLVVVAGGTGEVAPFTTTSVAGLDLATGNGLMDVTSGALTISSGLTAPQLVAELIEGRGAGSWTGTSGITSSTAAAEVAASTQRAVGWLDNGDGSLTVAYAAPGDTNLDWSIDILDAANFLAGGKFDTGAPATWLEGDFSYDGIVDILDAADFLFTGLYNTGNYNTAPGVSGAVAAVPEPSSVALAAGGMIAAVGWGIRRRYR